MSPRVNVRYNCRNKASSPVCLPLHGPIAQSSTTPHPSEINATSRAIGKPKSGLLHAMLRIPRLVLLSVRHRHCRAIDNLHRPSTPPPSLRTALLQPLAHPLAQ